MTPWRLLVLLCVLTLSLVGIVHADDELTPAQWHEKERNGLGFGLVAGTGVGFHVYYDRNLSGQLQVHVDLQEQAVDEVNVFNTVILTTTKSAATAALRYFPKPDSGWFVGGGTGIGSVMQTYAFGGDTTSKASFIPIFADAGWQGWDGYYFTVNLQLGGAAVFGKTDKTGNIPSVGNNNSIAENDFNRAASGGANGIFIGFGWYLQ